jgi:hypothetical protein
MMVKTQGDLKANIEKAAKKASPQTTMRCI